MLNNITRVVIWFLWYDVTTYTLNNSDVIWYVLRLKLFSHLGIATLGTSNIFLMPGSNNFVKITTIKLVDFKTEGLTLSGSIDQ